jgi:hypothetical protein
MLLQVLDFLIRRYADSPEAARPARSDSTAAFHSNDRLIVVHQHLGRGKIAGVKTQAEAERRIGDVLGRMCRGPEKEADEIAERSDFGAWIDKLAERPEPPPILWRDISRRVSLGLPSASGLLRTIAASLKQSPYLPRVALAFLCRELSQRDAELKAAELLLRCRSESVPDYIARAWRERVNAGWNDNVTAKLQGYLLDEADALDAVRERLADTSATVRLAATRLLGQAGTLDDVALLSDLVSLPRAADEAPGERQTLLAAMWSIARRG